MKHFSKIFLLAVTVLSGCAVIQKPIPSSAQIFSTPESSVAVAIGKLPEPDMSMMGAQGLLDLMINKANAKPIVERLQQQDFSAVKKLSEDFTKGLEDRQIKVVVVPGALDTTTLQKFTEGSGDGVALLDYRPLAKQYGVDRLLLIQPTWLGTMRNYHGFIPLGAPVGYVAIIGQLVDLRTNRLQWYSPIVISTPVTGKWDDAPNYDNLMKAVDESTRNATVKIREAFFVPAGTIETAANTATSTATSTATVIQSAK
ncbi:MAG: hypothetical protein ABI171_10890 [Collimonas sp.]|uniref:hypothetical protein n=1 Tax=Collimonas sp. TaxID=1963772 RepID=UPI0032648179